MDSTDNTASTTHFQVPRRAVWVGLALVCLAGTAYAVVGSGLLRSAAGRDGATDADIREVERELQESPNNRGRQAGGGR